MVVEWREYEIAQTEKPMRSYFAVQGSEVYQGGLLSVYNWSRGRATTTNPVKILTARGGERNARIVFEVTPEMVRVIKDGRYLPVRELHGKK